MTIRELKEYGIKVEDSGFSFYKETCLPCSTRRLLEISKKEFAEVLYLAGQNDLANNIKKLLSI